MVTTVFFCKDTQLVIGYKNINIIYKNTVDKDKH